MTRHYFRFAQGAIVELAVPQGRDASAFATEVFGERPVVAIPVPDDWGHDR